MYNYLEDCAEIRTGFDGSGMKKHSEKDKRGESDKIQKVKKKDCVSLFCAEES